MCPVDHRTHTARRQGGRAARALPGGGVPCAFGERPRLRNGPRSCADSHAELILRHLSDLEEQLVGDRALLIGGQRVELRRRQRPPVGFGGKVPTPFDNVQLLAVSALRGKLWWWPLRRVRRGDARPARRRATSGPAVRFRQRGDARGRVAAHVWE